MMDHAHRHGMLWIILLAMLLISGCAGIRPAVQSPPRYPAPKQLLQDTTATAPGDSTLEGSEQAMVTELDEPPAEPEGAIEHAPRPVDSLDLPAEALPLQPTGLAPVSFLPTSGPAPKGEEPAALSEGWRVQIASVSDQATAKEIETDVRAKSGLAVHTRWQGDRYTLLVGNFSTESEAENLRDQIRSRGYEGAFVVRAPVISSKDAEAHKSTQPAAGTPEQVDGWRVQVMSLAVYADAEQAAREVSAKTGFKTYVEEVDGSYKVRAGNFPTRAAASDARGIIVNAGYEGAFPVETRIIPE